MRMMLSMRLMWIKPRVKESNKVLTVSLQRRPGLLNEKHLLKNGSDNYKTSSCVQILKNYSPWEGSQKLFVQEMIVPAQMVLTGC